MPHPSDIEVPVTIDLGPAADALEDLASALEVTGAFLRGKATDLRKAPASAAYRAIGEQLVAEANAAGTSLDEAADAVLEVITREPEDPIKRADSVGIEVTD